MFDTQKVLDTMRINGPVIPTKIAKVLSTDTIMASAVLSELLSSKKIKISKLKVGGTPVYFLPGQESRLQEFEKHLNEKDRRTVELLRQKKIIRDRAVEPLTRVSLREIKDFAIPLQVNINGQREVFWKWYLLSNQDAEQILKSLLSPPKPPEIPKVPEAPKPIQERPVEQPVQPKPEVAKEIPKEPAKQEVKPAEPEVKPEPVQVKEEVKPAEPEVKQESVPVKQEVAPAPEKPKVQEEVKKEYISESKVQKEVQKTIAPKPKKKEVPDVFFNKVKSHFSRKEINVVKEIIKKKNEADYVIGIPSALGELEYFCRIKNKKTISDSDLDGVFAHGQLFKLPIVLVISGELSKKAKEKLKEFKNITIKKI